MTGCTSLQINSQKRPIEKIDVPASIVEALRSVGHEVEWRRVVPGEDLSSFDVAWVNLAPVNSLNGRAGAMGALYTLGSGLPCVGFFDDWQFSAVINGMRALTRTPKMLYKYLLVGSNYRGEEAATYFDRAEAYAAYDRACAASPGNEKKMYVERYYFNDVDENVKPYHDRLIETAREMLDDRWERGMVPVVPMYAWGDRAPVRKRMPKKMGKIEPLDPSSTIYPLIADHAPLPPEEKERAWMLGALMPHDTWIDKKPITWPVQYLGARKMVKRGGERVKTEHDVIDRYNKVWGILSPPYPHAGCGWWRSRFMYSAKIQSVLVCDKGEGDPIGSAYKVGISTVEKLSTDGLANLAREQADQLRPWMPDPRTFVQHCDHIVHRAVSEDKGLKL